METDIAKSITNLPARDIFLYCLKSTATKLIVMYVWVYCVALPCLFVCLTLLACFFLSSFSSLIKTCTWSNKQTRQSNTAHPRQSLFPRVGLEPTTLYTHSRQSALPLSYQGSSAGWAQISHLTVHLMNRLKLQAFDVSINRSVQIILRLINMKVCYHSGCLHSAGVNSSTTIALFGIYPHHHLVNRS